jgi:NO-binding membrane sensor protein with MHYT domain
MAGQIQFGLGQFQQTSIATAGTTDLVTGAPTLHVNLTGGVGPITSFGTSIFKWRVVNVEDAVTINHDGSGLAGSIFLPTAAPIDAGAGDCFQAYSDAVGAWKVIFYQRADGSTLTPSVLDADLSTIAALTPSNDDVLQRKAGAWTNRTIAQLVADIGGGSFQPLDADLTAIAALTTTSFGRGLLALADAAALQTSAGLVIGTNVEAHDADLTTIAGLTASNDDVLQRKAGAWANRTIAQLATDLGLAAGYQPLDADLTSIAALTTTSFGRGLLALANAAALQAAAGTVIGTNVEAHTVFLSTLGALADYSAFRTAAGLVPGTDIEAHDTDLTTIAGLTPTNDDVLQRKAGAWANRTIAQLATDLGLAAGYQPLDSDLTAIAALTTTTYGRSLLTMANTAALATDLALAATYQPLDSDLTAVAALAPTNDDIIQRKAGAWTNRTIAQLATDLGLAAGYQPLDSDLTSIAALTTTSFGRALLELADAAAMRAVSGSEALGLLAGVNTQTASYTLVITDIGKVVEMNVGTANNLTVPLNATVAFAIGSRIDIAQIGAGQTTVVATGGVTIRQRESKLKLTAQYAGASLYKRGTDEWMLFGDLAL